MRYVDKGSDKTRNGMERSHFRACADFNLTKFPFNTITNVIYSTHCIQKL